MTPLRSLSLALFVLFAIAPFSAFAQDAAEQDPEPEVSTPPPDGWDRLLAVAVTAGVDTPLGIAGAQLEIAPIRFLDIYAGVGVGRDGVRLGGGLHGRFPVDNFAVGALAGFHAGPLDWDSRGAPRAQAPVDPSEPVEYAQIHRWWEFALFFHAGLSAEYRHPSGFFGRIAFGIDALVTGDATTCRVDDGVDCSLSDDNLFKPVRGWAGLTFGYAFEL